MIMIKHNSDTTLNPYRKTSHRSFSWVVTPAFQWFKLPLKHWLESESEISIIFLFDQLMYPNLYSSKISQNINTDEAAVLGSAFYGASLSRQFRTKKIKLQDISTHDLQVSYEADGKNGM